MTLTSAEALNALVTYPASLNAAALSGDFNLGGTMGLWPSQSGQLNIFADGDVNLRGANPDIDIADLHVGRRSVAVPLSARWRCEPDVARLFGVRRAAAEPGRTRAAAFLAEFRTDGLADPNPARIVSATGMSSTRRYRRCRSRCGSSQATTSSIPISASLISTTPACRCWVLAEASCSRRDATPCPERFPRTLVRSQWKVRGRCCCRRVRTSSSAHRMASERSAIS